MSVKFKRYSLKPKDARVCLKSLFGNVNLSLDSVVGLKSCVEVAEADFGRVFLVDGRPLFLVIGEVVLPTLVFGEVLAGLPKVVVDMGAIPHVCNGADVMRPGVVRVEGESEKGDLVVIVDVKHGKFLALGEILYSSAEFAGVKKGIVVKNLHFVGDKFWNLVKALTQ